MSCQPVAAVTQERMLEPWTRGEAGEGGRSRGRREKQGKEGEADSFPRKLVSKTGPVTD